MTVHAASLDAMEVDALHVDRYLDALLAAADRRAGDVPADPALDPTCRLVARRLRDELVRTHPSFRFEERLARTLADAAVRMRLEGSAAGAEAVVVPFLPAPAAGPAPRAELAGPPLPARAGGSRWVVDAPAAAASLPPLRPVVARPLLVGGALTSAALSLAGAAYVAWRLTRGAPVDPPPGMARVVRLARAVRAAHEVGLATATRAAAAAGPAAGDAAPGNGGRA